MLIHNVDTSDKLTNGMLGEILGYKRRSDGNVVGVIVHFYNPKVGYMRRQSTPELQQQYPDKRPITIKREEFSYSLSKESYKKGNSSSKAKLIQFPLCLAFAATAHKFQGQ